MPEENTSSLSIAFEVITPPIILAGLIGNLIVCAIIVSDKKMRTSFNYLLLNLALSDLMCSLLGAVFYSGEIRNHYFSNNNLLQSDFDGVACKIGVLSIDISTKSSVFTLAAISTDRFYAVVRPLRHRKTMSKRNIWVLVAVIWSIALLTTVPLILLMVEAPNTLPETSVTLCLEFMNAGNSYKAVAFVDLIVAYVIPMGIILRTSFAVIRHLWSLQPTLPSQTSQVLLKARKRITKIVLSVIIAFNVFWLPWAVLQGLLLIGALQKFDNVAVITVFSSVLASASINPLLYSLQSQQFRRKVKNIFRCR